MPLFFDWIIIKCYQQNTKHSVETDLDKAWCEINSNNRRCVNWPLRFKFEFFVRMLIYYHFFCKRISNSHTNACIGMVKNKSSNTKINRQYLYIIFTPVFLCILGTAITGNQSSILFKNRFYYCYYRVSSTFC